MNNLRRKKNQAFLRDRHIGYPETLNWKLDVFNARQYHRLCSPSHISLFGYACFLVLRTPCARVSRPGRNISRLVTLKGFPWHTNVFHGNPDQNSEFGVDTDIFPRHSGHHVRRQAS
ncbi:hypothetical protein BU24DRAFT_422849 [Aaosphaeria arxii CBS 175.79]|uniref:Uncharacterized protein n=1 Tax=Aaosphaeria arxii CBS 175.79 TaxID=1450172 RepID=A0A6A5XUB0_9PLEO|nr:uncharacterized protein BU24DRAFT_422849 [Aaosphaeria arxii CBS 175.79]KAF2016506.1 hypothetical protein BU24DRAFT_422849 [Aaosphaeria arxii CBS 175.79]